MRPLHRSIAVASLLVIAAAGCASPTGSEPRYPENTNFAGAWPTATPEEQGLDPARLATARDLAALQPLLSSLLVIRNGHLVLEEYFNGTDDTTLVSVHAVTTSIMSALVGIAIRDGHIESVDQSIADFLVPGAVPTLDAAHRAITIRHLLTMTSGLAWQEGTQEEADAYAASPYNALWEYALSKPVADAPGSRINYNSAGASLLSVILTHATGMNTLAYARQKLLHPLGIDSLAWAKDGEYWYGGSAMRLRPRDAARLGALFVNQGVSAGTSLVPASWITQSLTPTVALGVPYRYGPVDYVNYGLAWWIDRQPNRDAFFAWGYGGQFIYSVPALKLVIVMTTDASSLTQDTKGAVEKSLLELIIDRIIPAVDSY